MRLFFLNAKIAKLLLIFYMTYSKLSRAINLIIKILIKKELENIRIGKWQLSYYDIKTFWILNSKDYRLSFYWVSDFILQKQIFILIILPKKFIILLN